MGKNYGEPIRYDPDFNGPIHNRSCTDIIWLIVFIVFLGGWGYLGYYSMKHGDVEKLLAPLDSTGRHCGLDSGLQDKKYLVFFDIVKCLSPNTPITGCPTTQVCVNQCPTETIMFLTQMTAANFLEYKPKMVCTYDVDVQAMTYNDALRNINEFKCASYVLKSTNVLSRCIGDLSTMQECKGSTTLSSVSGSDGSFCISNPKKQQTSMFNKATILDSYVGWIVASCVTFLTRTENTQVLSSQIVQDLQQSRWYMLGALVAVVLICFIYILLLRWVVAPVVWISIAGLIALLGFTVYVCYKNYAYYRLHPVILNQTHNVMGYVQSIFTKQETWMVLLVVVAIILVIILLIVIFLRSRITIAIALIREGSKAVTDIKSTIFFPIFPWILQCAVIVYGVVVLMFLFTVGDPSFRVVNLKNDTDCNCKGMYTEDYATCDPGNFTENCHAISNPLKPCSQATCYFIGIDNPNFITYLHLVNLLGFFWTMFFISGVSDMMLASTFSTWYWTFRKKNVPFFTLTSGICRTLKFHLGTVALGALIIAIVRVIRVILEYIDHKVKKFDNPLTRCILCCCKCFFWCLESFLKFINKNAYIMCAVHGHNFCKSAREAFSLLMRNIIRVVVLDKVTDFIFFLSKLLISIGVGFAVYYLLEWKYLSDVLQGQPITQLHYNYVPAIILGIATYLISSIFFNVYSMAVDTLFLCFLEDCERNDGSAEKPYFMSKNLMKILGKRNKQI